MQHYQKFTNVKCEYFPCHEGVAEEDFNCLFCYCPLYLLGPKCGGDFKLSHGIKDCSRCIKPHDKDSYDYISGKMGLVFAPRD
ncbi:MAG TPA: metal-binding protein [Tissierellia bacterium]|nr:metal-binding protein [Tissierellia bacterium]